MQLRELSSGTRICPETRLDSLFYSHNNVVSYLALDDVIGHSLAHLIPAECSSLAILEKVVQFYRDALHIETRCGQFEEFYYFSEPFPLGEFMFEWLERRERVSVTEALKRIVAFLKILTQAHEIGLYHGRITPQSILLERTDVSLSLRMMGLGTALALNTSDKFDIDWFDYTFDLEGMTPAAIDIYGVAIILMGLVSGEQGIDSFESTGLLPPPLRGGMIQQVMERALALRIDAYPTVLEFSLDLEAALLEADDRQGEVYVSDLVGFESAVRSIASISRDNNNYQESGEWNAIVDTLEQEERSSLLCSLTSLTAIKAVGFDDEDDDVTCVTSIPQQVLGMQRIKTAHARSEDGETTGDYTRPLGTAGQVSDQTTPGTFAPLPESDDYDDEDDAPTRIMKRPTYATISFGQEAAPGVHSSIEAVLEASSTEVIEESPVVKMEKRIRGTQVAESDHVLKPVVLYPEEVVEPAPAVEEKEPECPRPQGKALVRNAADPAPVKPATQGKSLVRNAADPAPAKPEPEHKHKEKVKEADTQPHLSQTQKTILRILIFVIIFLILAAFIIYFARNR
ncbi:MAG: hypothetical protein IJU23_12975 [Proteobacteria bacterium]|nr:hypothetical protein [Pseudomonadota bacterium]